jgi:hypothetical protein
MRAEGVDRDRLAKVDELFERYADLRPDLLGAIRVWTGADRYIEAAYFTSVADARAGERAEMPSEVQELMAEFHDLMEQCEFLDLAEPQLG